MFGLVVFCQSRAPEYHSDIMKIIYLGHFNNLNSNRVEEDIKYAFEQLGHKVIAVPEKDIEKLLEYKADMLLFHKAGVGTYIDLNQWVQILSHITYKKVMWYFDPINLIQGREQFIETVADYIEYGFLVDDTWRRRHKYKNLYSLKEGIGHSSGLGHPVDDYKCDVAFAGSVYGEREQFVGLLKNRYGGKFRVFANTFGQNLSDLHASAKIIVAPDYPSDEFYWSSRFYLTLGSGGFLVHPDLYGLKEEFTEGKHFVGYKGWEEMIATIDYFLEHEEERKTIRQQGYKRCLEVATFKHRVEKMLKTIYGD